jgi:hypothetical protein
MWETHFRGSTPKTRCAGFPFDISEIDEVAMLWHTLLYHTPYQTGFQTVSMGGEAVESNLPLLSALDWDPQG